ncbi:hypothetical protein JB92DRAFT_3101294 [Gautieria morchelliformis]|nr:hypothetical protein JB92DRAFT_3101294 [Gautieria morchelliformis]
MAAASRTISVAESSEACMEFLRTLPRLNLTELPSGRPSTPEERSGVTKLPCGHLFCMADISEWIHTPRGTCPTCRDLFLVIPELPDDESSDGGEYIPGSDSVADDMMDGEMWSDEDGGAWTDGEDMSFDEGITEGETDSSSERSSDGAQVDLDETSVPAAGQLVQSSSMDTAVISLSLRYEEFISGKLS